MECEILDLPGGLQLNLLGVKIEIGRIRITADRAGLLGGLLAALTCGGVAGATALEDFAQTLRAVDAGEEASSEAPQDSRKQKAS